MVNRKELRKKIITWTQDLKNATFTDEEILEILDALNVDPNPFERIFNGNVWDPKPKPLKCDENEMFKVHPEDVLYTNENNLKNC